MGRTTRVEWAARIARWRESGKSASRFVAEIGVPTRTLSWWKWRLASMAAASSPKRALVRRSAAPITKTPTTKAPTAISPLTFVEMSAVVESDRLEVVLPSSVRVRVRPGFDGATLGRLLDVLEARR